MAPTKQVLCHGPAHYSKTDESNLCHYVSTSGYFEISDPELRMPRIALFTGAGSAQDVRHTVIPLLAGVFKYRTPDGCHHYLAAPRLGPRGGILNGEFVRNQIGADARQAFDNVKLLGRPAECGLVSEIGCIDDQRFAFPMTAGISAPLAHRFGKMRPPIERDHANIVYGFVQDCHITSALDNLEIAVVAAGQHRRPFIRPQNAALRQTPVLRAVERVEPVESRLCRYPLLRFRDHWRNSALRPNND